MSVRSRLHFSTLAPLALLLAAGCSKDEPSPPPTSAAPSAAAQAQVAAEARVDVEPTIGGKVFLVGEHACELAIHADGRVEGLVFDAKGSAVTPERVTEFSVALSAEADARPRVKLLWDAATKRFRGQADAHAALTTRPIDVTLQIDGAAQSGVLDGYALLPAPAIAAEAQADATLKAPKASAKLGAKALADARVPAPRIKAPNAAASLQAKADAKVAVPKPRVDVGAKASAGTETKKSGAGASVKAKATFGFGN
jgi:hypothetical protein